MQLLIIALTNPGIDRQEKLAVKLGSDVTRFRSLEIHTADPDVCSAGKTGPGRRTQKEERGE